MIAMIGTSDRLCWLAETCKILLLSSSTSTCTGPIYNTLELRMFVDTRICPKLFCVDLLLCRSATTKVRDCADLRVVRICEEIRRLSFHRTSGLQNFTDTCRATSCVSATLGQGMQVCRAVELSSSKLSELQGGNPAQIQCSCK